jgi:hypothetical protein
VDRGGVDVFEQAAAATEPASRYGGRAQETDVRHGDAHGDPSGVEAVSALTVEPVGTLAHGVGGLGVVEPRSRHSQPLERLGCLLLGERGLEEPARFLPRAAHHRLAGFGESLTRA